MSDPRELLAGFIRHWYPMYDGVDVRQDERLRIEEIALSTMLNSRISGNTGGRICVETRAVVEEQLSHIPPGIDLLDVSHTAEIPGEHAISRAITAMCDVRRCKLAVSTKILHKKRPGLIPIFDSVVERHYWPRFCPTVRGRTYGDYAIALTRQVHRDMLSARDELRDLREWTVRNGTPMTACRILNALMWAVLSGNESNMRSGEGLILTGECG